MDGVLRVNAAVKFTAAATLAVLIGVTAGCSSSTPATARQPDPWCRAALAALPARLPVTEKQAVADEHAVENAVEHARGTENMVRGMANIVGGAVARLGHDIAKGRDIPAARITYNADVLVLKSYCRVQNK